MNTPHNITSKAMAKTLVTEFSNINNVVYAIIREPSKLAIIKANINIHIGLVLVRIEDTEAIEFWKETKEEVRTLIINSMSVIVSK